jgi:hypothetical protein
LVKSKRTITLGERPFRRGLLELEIECKLQEIRYENHRFKVRMIAAVAAVFGVVLDFDVVRPGRIAAAYTCG